MLGSGRADGMAEPADDFAAIIRRAKALDGAAFAVLYRRTVTPIYRFLMAQLGSADEAEELTQDVFVSALAAIGGLRASDESGALAWLFQIARHKLADHLRQRYRRPATQLEDAACQLPDPEPQPDESAEAREERERVQRALAQLTAEQREVMVCKYTLGYSNERTAQLVGKSINAVNQLHHRALASLQRLLAGTEPTG